MNGFESLNPLNYKVSELYGHTPLFPIFHAFMMKIIDPSIVSLRLTSLIVSLSLLAFFTYLIYLYVKSFFVATLSTLLLSINTTFYPFTQSFLPDIFHALFFIIYLILEKKNYQYKYIIAFLLPWVRESTLIFAIALWLYDFCYKYKFKINKCLLKSAPAIMIYSSFIYFTFIFIHKDPILFLPKSDFTFQISVILMNFFNLSFDMFFKSGIIILILISFFTQKSSDKKWYKEKYFVRALYVAFIFIMAMSILKMSFIRYHLISVVFLFISIAQTLLNTVHTYNKKRIYIIIFIYGVIACNISHDLFINGSQGINKYKPYLEFVRFLNRNAPTENIVIQNGYYHYAKAQKELEILRDFKIGPNQFKNVYTVRGRYTKALPESVQYLIVESRKSYLMWLNQNNDLFPSLDFNSFNILKYHHKDFYIFKAKEIKDPLKSTTNSSHNK